MADEGFAGDPGVAGEGTHRGMPRAGLEHGGVHAVFSVVGPCGVSELVQGRTADGGLEQVLSEVGSGAAAQRVRLAVSRCAGDGVRGFAAAGVAARIRCGSAIFDPLTAGFASSAMLTNALVGGLCT